MLPLLRGAVVPRRYLQRQLQPLQLRMKLLKLGVCRIGLLEQPWRWVLPLGMGLFFLQPAGQ